MIMSNKSDSNVKTEIYVLSHFYFFTGFKLQRMLYFGRLQYKLLAIFYLSQIKETELLNTLLKHSSFTVLLHMFLYLCPKFQVSNRTLPDFTVKGVGHKMSHHFL